MSATLYIDDRQVLKLLKKIGHGADDGTVPLTRLDLYAKTQIAREWNRIKAAGGGTARGKAFPGMKPQYVRADGTVVPAWGGVPKVRGRGKVKGRKRPSGKRVTQSSVVGKDTGFAMGDVLNARSGGAKPIPGKAQIIGKKLLLIGATLEPRTKKQLSYRNVMRWDRSKDVRAYKKIAIRYIRDLIRGGGGPPGAAGAARIVR